MRSFGVNSGCSLLLIYKGQRLRRAGGQRMKKDAARHVTLGHLRRKLQSDPTRPRYIVTEPGLGYRLERKTRPIGGWHPAGLHRKRIKKRKKQSTQVRSSGRLLGSGVVPTAVGSDDRVSLFRPPSAAPIGTNAVVCSQDWIDHRPGGLDCVLAGEERAIAIMASPKSRS